MVSIGHIAAVTGVSSRTIRYYEEMGVLPPPERTSGGTRQYRIDFRFHVQAVLSLKELGFTLDEIGLIGRAAVRQDVAESERRHAMQMIEGKRIVLERQLKLLGKLAGRIQ
jgi:DNA-binding transcriptional MerR regulator